MQAYSNPERESEPHALPDVEVFYHSDVAGKSMSDGEGNELPSGYYYQFCFPGCLPDSEPLGPFSTADQALADARQNAD